MKAHQLKNAILQLAVQGKLVPQNPNDEPASKLLERITAEKRRRIKAGEIKKDKRDSTIVRRGASFYEIANTTERCIDDELPFDLPNGWEWARLKTIVDYTIGKTPPRKELEYWSNGIFPWVTIADLVTDGIVSTTKEKVNDYAYAHTFKGRISKAGTLLMSFKLTVGKVSILGVDAFHNEAIISIRPYVDPNKETTNYLYKTLPLLSQNGDTKSAIKGDTLNSESLNALLIPIPPLAEQRRIVNRLESLLPLVEAYGKAEAELSELDARFPDMLKKSILQDAVQGKLVPQNPNDEPASVLLERIRAEKQRLIKEGKIKKDKHESVIFRRDNSHYEKLDGVERCIDGEIPFEIPENWGWVRWGSIAESIQYGYNAPAKQEGRIRMVRISDIHENTVAWSSVPFCDIEDSDIPTYLLQPNDILFARTGGTVGKSFLVSEVPCESIYAGYLIRTRYSSLLCPQYLKFFMESPLYWQQLKSGTTATAQPNCNGQTLAKMLFPLPPANEQLRIVKNLVRTFAIIDKM